MPIPFVQKIDFYSVEVGALYWHSKYPWKRHYQVFDYGGPYHVETSPLICSENQWTSFYMIGTSVMKWLNPVPLKRSKSKSRYKKVAVKTLTVLF